MSNGKWSLVVLATAVVCLWLGASSRRDLSAKITALDAKIEKLLGGASAEDDASLSVAPADLHTTAEASEAVKKLGTSPTAERLAEVLAAIDLWTVKPEEEKPFHECRLSTASQLRRKVKDEVVALQKASLEAATGLDGVKKHSEAGRILALYPMSEDKEVIEEAKRLSAQQAELATRLEVLRRQRYNRWATERIEAAIDGYNKNSSYTSPKKENPKLMDSLVANLGEVDPGLLEPVVLELYNYVVDLTKGSISEKEKVDLAKRLTEPSLKRKTLGDF